MTDKLLCPLKFANPRPADSIDWNCEHENCAWWSKSKEKCALVMLAMGLWATLDAVKEKVDNNK